MQTIGKHSQRSLGSNHTEPFKASAWNMTHEPFSLRCLSILSCNNQAWCYAVLVPSLHCHLPLWEGHNLNILLPFWEKKRKECVAKRLMERPASYSIYVDEWNCLLHSVGVAPKAQVLQRLFTNKEICPYGTSLFHHLYVKNKGQVNPDDTISTTTLNHYYSHFLWIITLSSQLPSSFL